MSRRTALVGLLGACLVSACATAPGPVQAPDRSAPVSGTEPSAHRPGEAETTPAEPTPLVSDPASVATEAAPAADAVAARTGLDVYDSFLAGLAEPGCANADPRWLRHFAHATDRVGDPDSDTSALFAHVVESLRQAGLPTEFALIPFVESGYRPGARSKAGPAGLWQFVAITARDHGVRVFPGYDERLSPAKSTRAAVQYLGALYERFDRNWRLALMAYNAGEFRVKRALARSGGDIGSARPGSVPGLSPITYAYVEKLHALACLLEEAGESPQWRERLDRPLMSLQAQRLEGARSLDAWAATHGHDAATLRRLNPGLAGTWPAGHAPLALVPETTTAAIASVDAGDAPAPAKATDTAAPITHKVRAGDSAWSIARRHGTTVARVLELNGLHPRSVLRPGMVLKVR